LDLYSASSWTHLS